MLARSRFASRAPQLFARPAQLLARPTQLLAHPTCGLLARTLSTIAPEHIVHSKLPPLKEPLPTEGLYPFLRAVGRWHEVPDKVALRCSLDDFRPITYKELDGRVSATAHKLRAMGFKQGDVLNIHLPNCQQYVVAFMAVATLGGTVTTSNPAYVARELATQHTDSGTKLVLSSRAYDDVVTAAAAESGLSDAIHWIEDAACFANAPPTDLPLPLPERPIDAPRDLVVLPYSSGTTGMPKGVMLYVTRGLQRTNVVFLRAASDI